MDVNDVKNLLSSFKKEMKQNVADLVGNSVTRVMLETKKALEAAKASTVQTASVQQPVAQPKAASAQAEEDSALKDAFEDSLKLMH